MSLDIGPRARTVNPREPQTVWVRTNVGLVETTMPRPAPTFIAGDTPPNAETGYEGAVYLNTATGRFYGPKVGNVWPAIGTLVPTAGPHELRYVSIEDEDSSPTSG
jgi:hypothetical protein